jgi:RimJ/RimL family protein N-acetyltransferase
MIGSNRIILTVLHESDVSREYLETLNDSEYLKYSRNANSIHTLSSQIQYITKFKLSNNLLFGIKNTDDGKLLGTITCYINFNRMTLNLGFLIFKNQQGKGYASEALGLLIPYLQAQFPGMRAVIGLNKNDFAMHDVVKKLNFHIESEDSREDNLNLHFVRSFPQINSELQPMIPDFIFNAKRIGVAAYDAGGAEQISWLLQSLPQKVLCYIGGPALRIFDNSGLLFEKVDQLNQIMECDLVITGSGWMSELEITAIREAKLRDIPCITVLDHWVNFAERFGKDEENQPQILAVTNFAALEIAQKKFPNKVVWMLPDFQMENYQEEIKKVEKPPTVVLVLLEPTSLSNSKFAINKDVIASLIETAFSVMHARGLISVLVRPHPSQLDDPHLLRMLKEIPSEFEISKGASLIDDLKVSKMVLGLSSYALYISAMCGIETYSYFAGVKGHWTEMFPKISPPPTNL